MRQFSTLLALLPGMLSDPASPLPCKDALGRPVLHWWRCSYHSLSNQLPFTQRKHMSSKQGKASWIISVSLRLLKFWGFLTAFNLRNTLYMTTELKIVKHISLLASDRNKTQQQAHGVKEKAFMSTGMLHLAYWNWLRPWQQVTQSCTAVRLQQVCRKCCASVL